MNITSAHLSDCARTLGYLGLLPQLCITVYAVGGIENVWISQAAGFAYAALIFSFLGGTWWGVGVMSAKAPLWIFAVAILPSLIALAAYLPWIWGLEWPEPSLAVLGIGLLASPAVDRALATHVEMPIGWLLLRLHLSIGLGLLTLALCLF
jgi:Protein of unknown function (DUF3429)